MTPAQVEELFTDHLKFLYDTKEAGQLAYYVIRYICGTSQSQILINRHKPISEIHRRSLIRVLDELKTGRPVQYILGETEFYGLRFKVNPSVLIPRSETEELVEWVIKEVGSWEWGAGSWEPEVGSPKPEVKNPTSDLLPQTSDFCILDIGTGSGCIAISLKKHLPQTKVYALDISPDALETAMQNAVLNDVEIEFLQGDILKDPLSAVQYSLIISNPPYVTLSEKEGMHVNVRDHEPDSALFVPDNNPLIFYDRIADLAKTHLAKGGVLFFEINETLGKQTQELLKNKRFNTELKKDLQGKDRMIKARLM